MSIRSASIRQGITALAIVAAIGLNETSARADTLRAMNVPTNANAAGSWPALPGCDTQVVLPSLTNAGNYSYTQAYSTTYNLVHAPQSYFNCLNGLLQEAQQLENLFSGNGTLSGLLSGIAKDLMGNMMQQLGTKACSTLQAASLGLPSGNSPANPNITSLLNGGH